MRVGFLNLLTLVFVTAKLFGVVQWSWWLVLMPTFVSVGLIVLVLLLVTIAEARE
jgi:hypothetical protein